MRNDIIEILHDFMMNKEIRKKKLGKVWIKWNQLEMMSTKRTVKIESEREKKERIAKEGKKYWEKLT